MEFENDINAVKPRWPRTLVVPLEKDFNYGSWIQNDKSNLSDVPGSCEHRWNGVEMTKARSRALRYSCNTQCCLVGWVALAFGENGVSPDDFMNPASAEFMNKIIELSGSEPVNPADYECQERFINNTAERASSLFEGFDRNGDWRHGTRGKLTGKQARSLWKRAGRSFGYDTANLVS